MGCPQPQEKMITLFQFQKNTGILMMTLGKYIRRGMFPESVAIVRAGTTSHQLKYFLDQEKTLKYITGHPTTFTKSLVRKAVEATGGKE